MRLTLRTLLAHLDKTLDADDDAAIAAKLRESAFAAGLVKRITASIASNQLGAVSPVSTSTADDPNRIGEYLDSVLSSEQVAEIERICLESEGHLAEVAACHQILTLVLGNPAEVPPTLRSRIYELGQRRATDSSTVGLANGAAAGSVRRSAALSGSSGDGDAITQALAADLGPTASPATRSKEVIPVGLDDSGVSNAPTRLREVAHANAQARREIGVAGTRPINAAEASELFKQRSHLTPWLIGLALAASFLFVAIQTFAPLLRKSSSEDDPLALVTAEPNPSGKLSTEPIDRTPDPATEVIRESVLEIEASEAPPMVDVDPAIPGKEMPAVPLQIDAAEVMELPVPVAEMAASPETADQPPLVATSSPPPNTSETELAPTIADIMPAAASPPADTPPEIAAISSPTPLPATSLVSDNSLLLVRKPADNIFVWAEKNDPIINGSTVVCPPLFRDQLAALGELDVTLIGPAKVELESADSKSLTMAISSGRVLIKPQDAATSANTDSKSLRIVFGEFTHELVLQEQDASAAIDVVSIRSPGTDPEEVRATAHFIEVLAVRGPLSWTTEGSQSVIVNTGEVLRWSPRLESSKTVLTGMPTWLEPPVATAANSLDVSAREGLLGLVRAKESIEMSLREAIGFRRAEVGALAAQTLALIDRPAVYFGGDGVFSNVKQKAFWDRHFVTLVESINRSPEAAVIVRDAINQMDAAEAAAIYRLLWLFSNEQLEGGSDDLLVSSLDSGNMTMRVLAIENLRAITGTSLFFKPENETAPRRATDIKKWETRLRIGDIRWATP